MNTKAFGVGLLVGCVAGLAGAAQAASGGRFPASTCQVYAEDVASTDISGAELTYNNILGDLDLACPMVDGNSWEKTQIDEVIVHGYDPDSNTTIWAQPCVDYTGGGGTCGSQFVNGAASVTGNSSFSFNPGTTWSSNGAHYGYLAIRLPPKIGATLSRLYGFKLVDNP